MEKINSVVKSSEFGEVVLSDVILNDIRIEEEPNQSIILCFKYCFTVMGLREKQFPEEHETLVILDFLKRYYGHLKLHEVKAAFLLAAAGRIQVDINEYGKPFNCVLLGNVLNAYIDQERPKAIDKIHKQLNQPEDKTPEQIMEINKEFMQQCIFPIIDKYNDDGNLFFNFLDVSRVYRIFRNAGFIHLTDDEKKDLWKKHSKKIQDSWTDKLKQKSATKQHHQFKKYIKAALSDPDRKDLKKIARDSAQKELIQNVLDEFDADEIKQRIQLTFLK